MCTSNYWEKTAYLKKINYAPVLLKGHSSSRTLQVTGNVIGDISSHEFILSY